MKNNELQSAAQDYSANHKRKRIWYNIVSALACIVVFITTYALIMPAITAEIQNLKDYILQSNGSISITIFDSHGNIVTDTVVEGDKYKLTFGMSVPEGGFSPGSYIYNLPAGLKITPNPGKNIELADGTVIGIWSVTESGSLEFDFNDESNEYQNITLSLDVIMEFDLTDDEIEFDGEITVTVLPAPDTPSTTPSVKKSGEITENSDGSNTIDWNVSIQGGEGFPLAGQVIKDTIVGEGHTFDGADKDIWVNVWVDGETYYSWEIDESDAIWTGNTFEYTIPQTITCIECNDPAYFANGKHHEWGNGQNHEIILGDNWHISMYMETVITDDNMDSYENYVTVGDLSADAKILPTVGAAIIKNGELINGLFHWTVEFNIPQSNTHVWHLWDEMKIDLPEGTDPNFRVDFDTATLKFKKGNNDWQTISTEYKNNDDELIYSYWIDEDTATGEYGGAEIIIYNKCTCTKENCSDWENGACACYRRGDYCACWHQTEATQFLLEYDTAASGEIIGEYGDMGLPLKNGISLEYREIIDGQVQGKDLYVSSRVNIPGIFSKKLIDKPGVANQYTALFNITVNEEKQDLSSMTETGGIFIEDHMSPTLFYEQGSMMITQTDLSGEMITLKENLDYTVTIKDSHTMEILILNPGPFEYILDYKCVLDLTGQTGTPVPYNNSAEIELFGKTYTVHGEEEFLTNYTTTGESFSVTVLKKDAQDGRPIPDTLFGLYNEQGNLITSMYSDENGKITFHTDMHDGIIFKKNMPYFIKEITASPGYILNEDLYWFYFGDTENADIEAAYQGVKYFSKNGSVFSGQLTITNISCLFELPSTGGGGEMICYILSAVLALSGIAIIVFTVIGKKKGYRLRC